VLHVAGWKYRTQKIAKNRHLGTITKVCLSGYIFATEAYIDNRKKLLNNNISSTCPRELRPTNDWDRIGSLGHPTKFQRVSRLGFVTASTSLTGGQPNFARCLAVSWAATLCIHFRRLYCPLKEFCQVQNSRYVQVLRSPILAALLHGTPAAGLSQTLRRGTRNGITNLSQRAPPIFGWAAITLGIGPHSSNFRFCFFYFRCSCFIFISIIVVLSVV